MPRGINFHLLDGVRIGGGQIKRHNSGGIRANVCLRIRTGTTWVKISGGCFHVDDQRSATQRRYVLVGCCASSMMYRTSPPP